ncbi:MAG: hypothetical protein NTY48_01035 [Candidatus Diapherotrites archaeon]|nr:hypothetical protein [Candidatus Diapherotrites archaeon]
MKKSHQNSSQRFNLPVNGSVNGKWSAYTIEGRTGFDPLFASKKGVVRRVKADSVGGNEVAKSSRQRFNRAHYLNHIGFAPFVESWMVDHPGQRVPVKQLLGEFNELLARQHKSRISALGNRLKKLKRAPVTNARNIVALVGVIDELKRSRVSQITSSRSSITYLLSKIDLFHGTKKGSRLPGGPIRIKKKVE